MCLNPIKFRGMYFHVDAGCPNFLATNLTNSLLTWVAQQSW